MFLLLDFPAVFLFFLVLLVLLVLFLFLFCCCCYFSWYNTHSIEVVTIVNIFFQFLYVWLLLTRKDPRREFLYSQVTFLNIVLLFTWEITWTSYKLQNTKILVCTTPNSITYIHFHPVVGKIIICFIKFRTKPATRSGKASLIYHILYWELG